MIEHLYILAWAGQLTWESICLSPKLFEETVFDSVQRAFFCAWIFVLILADLDVDRSLTAPSLGGKKRKRAFLFEQKEYST